VQVVYLVYLVQFSGRRLYGRYTQPHGPTPSAGWVVLPRLTPRTGVRGRLASGRDLSGVAFQVEHMAGSSSGVTCNLLLAA
jgi:hypothetical protein